jgi:hypothetical protein
MKYALLTLCFNVFIKQMRTENKRSESGVEGNVMKFIPFNYSQLNAHSDLSVLLSS